MAISVEGAENQVNKALPQGVSERRKHKLYVTRNTEYHFRDERCVAVRDRRTQKWLPSHLACGRILSGSIRFHENGAAVPVSGEPWVGEALYFATGGRELVTSALCEVGRPEKSQLKHYLK